MSRTIQLRYGTAEVDDSCNWGQLQELAAARYRSNADPEHASSFRPAVIRIFVTGWDMTDRHGNRLAFPDDVERMFIPDVSALYTAIDTMLLEEGLVEPEAGGRPAENPTPARSAASSTTGTSRPQRRASSRRR